MYMVNGDWWSQMKMLFCNGYIIKEMYKTHFSQKNINLKGLIILLNLIPN